jgi:hypothetical protein
MRRSVQGGAQHDYGRGRQARPAATGAGERANLNPQTSGSGVDDDALVASIRHEGNCMIGPPARPA